MTDYFFFALVWLKAQMSSESRYSAYWQFPPPNLHRGGRLANDHLPAVFARGFTCVVCLGFSVCGGFFFFGGWGFFIFEFQSTFLLLYD